MSKNLWQVLDSGYLIQWDENEVQILNGISLSCLGSYLQGDIKHVPLLIASESISEKNLVLRRANSDSIHNPVTTASLLSVLYCNATAGIIISLF